MPFGEVRTTVLERISTPELAPVWDMFRLIDSDKQAKVLLVSSLNPEPPWDLAAC